MFKKSLQTLLVLAVLVTALAVTPAAYAASACGDSVTVVRGDTLRKIAERCGTTVSALLQANSWLGSGNLIFFAIWAGKAEIHHKNKMGLSQYKPEWR